MDGQEVVLNLWYVQDEQGFIYSLRAKAYVADGSDEEKLAFLRERALLDYLIAEPFEVPAELHIGTKAKAMPVGHISMFDRLDSPLALFEEAIKAVERRIPAQSNIEIPKDPLVCRTPLVQNSQGVIEPRFAGQARF